jgi:RNAse (barnase) inhibitor barstar
LKTCLCCGYKTLEDNSIFGICPVCFWEDDTVCWGNADFIGGANGYVSLREAQKNFIMYGACDKDSLDIVRKPELFEKKDMNWRPYEDLDGNTICVDIDFKEVTSVNDLHELLKRSLGFPSFYGMNWNAFWDAITGLVEMPEKLMFYHWDKFKANMPNEATDLLELLREYNSYYPNKTLLIEIFPSKV